MLLLVTKAVPSLVRLRSPYLGRLVTPRHYPNLAGTETEKIVWAADNDAFSGFDRERFEKMLESVARTNGCKFVSCPDVVGDATATLELFQIWQPVVKSIRRPVALVGQDGLEKLRVPWTRLDAFFIGGSTEWKLGPEAASLVQEARQRGKWVHMGRVNSAKRIRYAESIGCHSVDGSGYSRFFDTHVPGALALLEELDRRNPMSTSTTDFTKVANTANERLIARIDAVYDILRDVPDSEDKRVLTYIREALTPEAIDKRHDDDKGVGHLHDVAKSRLKPYEKDKEPTA